jgi:hypothetical protein
MTHLSGGEPCLVDHFFFCRKRNWIVLVGYPLQIAFQPDGLMRLLDKIKKKYRPRHVSLIAPQVPPSIFSRCTETAHDDYYTLEARPPVLRSTIRRNLRRAREVLTVERAAEMNAAHDELFREFFKTNNPPPRVKNLCLQISGYVARAESAFVLNAWDSRQRLAAFYVIDLTARNFANYIIGCYSKKHYSPGASDLLLFETIQISCQQGKQFIHLGLGVNGGIRRFKQKWGAIPFQRYEMCELSLRKPSLSEMLLSWQRRR